MPVNASERDPRLAALFASELEDNHGFEWFDAHTHMGENDPDGRSATAQEIVEALDRAGQQRALIFAMHEPDGYPPANDAVLAACSISAGRLFPLARIDPKRDPIAEAERCLVAGARGFKLHPRSDEFPMPHPGVEAVVRIAHAHRLPVLFHAGRGIPHLGEAVVDYARRYPGARVILAHAGISDLGALDVPAAELPNLYFDTSWWQVSDQLQLFATVPPGRILHASDAPYGSPAFAAWMTLRLARATGLGRDARRAIAGGQLARVISGQEPADLGPPPGEAVLGMRSIRLERVAAYTTGAIMAAFRGLVPLEALQLAVAASLTTRDDDEARVLAAARELLRVALEECAACEAGQADVRAIVAPALAALVIAGTPQAGAPAA
ncbi:MAG TPA: amidohydrolase family protein [Solirubrobacteraceae bacterium]|nr:amidohydrolase family protein [Solirubrobacteraceae bacterium]